MSFFSLECTKIVSGWGSPAGGAYSAPPDPLAVQGREGDTMGEGRGRGRERMERGGSGRGGGGEGEGIPTNKEKNAPKTWPSKF